MKKIKFLGAAVLAASLIFAGCANGSGDEDLTAPETPAVENPTDSGDGTDQNNNNNNSGNNGSNQNNDNNSGNNNSGNNGGNTGNNGGNNSGNTGGNETGDTEDDEDIGTNYNAPDLSSYYKKSLLGASGITTESWDNVSTNTPNDDGSISIIPGTKWGSSTSCLAIQGFEAGSLSDYEYIVFTLDTTNFTFIYDEAEPDKRNDGVNIKIPETMKDLSSKYVADGKLRTYYAAISDFGSAPETATQFALIVGGTGTLKVNEVYLAAETDPLTKPVTAITVTASELNVLSGTTATITVKDSNYVDRTSEATFLLAEDDTTNSSIDGNVFTAGTTAGEAIVTVSWGGFEEIVTINVITEKDYGKYFKTTSGPAEDGLNETGYMDLWFQNWDPVVNITNATATETEYSIVRESVGGSWWSTQFFYKEEAGKTYDISFKVTSTVAGDITINKQVITLEANTPYEFTQQNAGLNDKGSIVAIQLGKEVENYILPAGTFTISDFSVTAAAE